MKQLRLRKTMPTSGTFVAVWKTTNGTHAEGFKWMGEQLYREIHDYYVRESVGYFESFDADADLTYII